MLHSSTPANRKPGIVYLAHLIGIVALLTIAAPAGAYPIDPNWSPPTTVYIPETGQSIDGLFLDLWRSGGGVMSYGNPITPEITEENGKIVQYYQFARFEYWPEGDENGYYVTLGEIGRELGPPLLVRRFTSRVTTAPHEELTVARAWQPRSDEAAALMAIEQPSYRFVPETRHGVWGGFRAFWEATGEAAYLGNPLSEEYITDGVSFQTFERGQLRWREGEDITMTPVGAMLADRYDISTEPQPQGAIPVYDEALFVPPVAIPAVDAAPPAPGGGRAVVISLSQQALWAYEDGVVVRSTYVSTGKEKFRTPTGLFTVNSKVPEQDMAGVIGGESYNVPKVPDVLYFTNRGHA
ncbi:MAG TPA: L,D-transpeptidase, partial [Thermomicrobiales bacterium]|nr:L,D-transpeptidase [Thermomicrobiales bacterium]